jgi:hypothetical protein
VPTADDTVAILVVFKMVTPIDPGPITGELIDELREIIADVTGTKTGYQRDIHIIRHESFDDIPIDRRRQLEIMGKAGEGNRRLGAAGNGTTVNGTTAPTPAPSELPYIPATIDDLNASVTVAWHIDFMVVASLFESEFESGATFASALEFDLASNDFVASIYDAMGIDCIVWGKYRKFTLGTQSLNSAAACQLELTHQSSFAASFQTCMPCI